jgi:hypothetical protein
MGLQSKRVKWKNNLIGSVRFAFTVERRLSELIGITVDSDNRKFG